MPDYARKLIIGRNSAIETLSTAFPIMKGVKMSESSTKGLSRRGFIAGAGAVAAGAAACAAASNVKVAKADEGGIPTSWDDEADVIVLGTGFAGLSAAVTILEEHLGSVIVLEAAPEAEAGGNSRVSGQLLFIPESPEKALIYQNNLNDVYTVDQDIMQAWADNICENYDWLTGLGADLQESTTCNPEFPDVEGSDGCHTYFIDGVLGNSKLWDFFMEVADWDDCQIEYNTRVTDLIYDPATREVYGVRAEDGRTFKANKGVIMACGGFENNEDMRHENYVIGYPDLMTSGTPYNVGDGINMVRDIGADLWHMNNFSLGFISAKNGEDGGPLYATWDTKDYIYVGPNAKRYAYEETDGLSKHGKFVRNGVYVPVDVPFPEHVIFGSKAFEAGEIFPPNNAYRWDGMVRPMVADSNQGFVDAGVIIKADTVRELAEKIGLDPDTLEETVNTYNQYCADNFDPDFGRGQDYYGNFSGMESSVNDTESTTDEERIVIEGFDLEPLEAPFYAFRQYLAIYNTQGGPRRGVDGSVLNTKGEPIPRLYAAGEFGAEYSYMYNGGGNASEAVSSGRLAARSVSALEPWE